MKEGTCKFPSLILWQVCARADIFGLLFAFLSLTRINFMKPDAPVNTQSAVYQAILEEEAKSKGTALNQEFAPYSETLRQSSTSPCGLSQSFRKLRSTLDGPEGKCLTERVLTLALKKVDQSSSSTNLFELKLTLA